MNISLQKTFIAVCVAATVSAGFTAFGAPRPNREAKQFRHSTTIEKERPELNEETKRLISAYRRNPSKENLAALRKQVEINYDKVIARKKAKLEELKRTARHPSKVQEMQEIVDEVVQSRESRIEQSMRRFTDPRLRPGSRDAKGGYLPVIGAAQNVSIAYTPVTNEDYAQFLKATKRKPPKDWVRGVMPADRAQHPVVNVSHADAVAYCQWLTNRDGQAIYRLPTEEEWEFAAGHMPKDADFNCGENNGTTPVDAYEKTRSACGAIDMWGNCWEWTSTKITSSNTKRGKPVMAVKGGSWSSSRMDCRTERKDEGREAAKGFGDVSFRVIRED
ncbi:MAG: SUMF1/EgtB/PvdO family nonheme iron enzyme [Planctomycetia bacterium]|nr:SUMF1/EgtB/PvdO family nonheme iron enzyme [Planctomycetia bacterium]